MPMDPEGALRFVKLIPYRPNKPNPFVSDQSKLATNTLACPLVRSPDPVSMLKFPQATPGSDGVAPVPPTHPTRAILLV